MDISQLLSSTNSNTNIVDRNETGFAGLDSTAFMKLLITQLQNQDPTEPVTNSELLNQLAMMRNLQSNIELGDSLAAITSSQNLSNAAAFIGRTVVGTNTNKEQVTGVVDRAFVADGEAFVGIGSDEIGLKQVESVSALSGN